MPKSIPSVGDANWGQPLNDHLAQLNDPSTGGINIWDNATQRDSLYWADDATDKDDFEGKTGYNREAGSFERWEISPRRRWVTLQKAVAPSAYRGPGRAQLGYDQTGKYFFLYNDQTDTARQLGEIVEIGFIIEMGPNNPEFDAQYSVLEIINSNRVRIARVNQKYEEVPTSPDPVTYTPSSTSPILANVSQADFFRVGDTFQGGFVSNGNKIIDGGGNIVGKNSPTEYVNSSSTFHNSSRTVFYLNRGPGVAGTHLYNIFEPTIKYTNDANQEVFTIDNAGSTRINALNAQNDDGNLIGQNPPLIAQRIIRSYDSLSRNTDEITISARYAISTGESYTNHSGVGINGYRVLGSEIYPSASSNPSDWNGNNGSNPAALTVRGGIQSEDLGVVQQDAWNGIIIRQSYKSGKINKFYAVRIWVVAASGGFTTPMDELWGIYETGHTSGMTQGDISARNYFQGNLGLGTKDGNDVGGNRLDYVDVNEKLVVYGNIEARTAGSKPGNIRSQNDITASRDVGANRDVTASRNVNAGDNITAVNNLTAGNNVNYGGSLNNTSDRRLKENIAPLDSTEALVKVKKIQGKQYNLKKDAEKKTRFGFVAQELEKVFPELVSTREEDEMKQVNYIDLIPVLTEALKAQQTRIEALEKRLSDLES